MTRGTPACRRAGRGRTGRRDGVRHRWRSGVTRVALRLMTPAGMVLLASCAAGPPPLPDGTVVIATVPTFCYRTLADPECLPAPEAGQAARFIGAGVGTRTFVVDRGRLASLP